MSEENEQLIKTPGPLGDNFMLERELGRGGMGGVYLGRDIMLDRPVAVKVMQKQYGEDAEFLAKFKKEAQAAAKLIHPNIAQIYSYGVVDDMPYIAMELVAGGSLQQVMKNATDGKTDIPRVLKICEQVAQALRCAADQGLVHGDIKPENILLDSNGNAKLVDFGLAGMQKDTTEIWGTPYYIAPEKLKKEIVDYRADMYNLGGTLYHALTGVAPFEGPDATAVVRKRFDGMPKKPSEVRSDIPPAVDALVMKMLAFDKMDRYPTFEALLVAFKDVMATGLTAAPATGKKAPAAGARKITARKMTVRNLSSGTRRMTATKISTGKMNLDGTGKVDLEGVENISGMTGKVNMDPGDGEEEEGGNPIRKVMFGVGGGIAVIALIIGGLVWYQVADKKARAEEKQASIVKNIGNARQAIADTKRIAEKFGHDFEDFAAKATAECESATKKIAAAVPEFADRLKPEISAELVAAIALTNTPVIAEGATNGVAGVTNAMAQVATAMAGAMQQMANAVQQQMGGFQIKPFRPPTEDEADPASPEHEEYEKLKKAHMEEQMKLFKAAMENPAKAAEDRKEAAGKAAEDEDDAIDETVAEPEDDDPVHKLEYQIKKLEISKKKAERKFKRELSLVGEDAVKDVNDLWNRAYSCQASVIKIGISVKQVFEAAAKADAYKDYNEANMQALAALSGEVTELYNGAKGSPEVENVQKGISYIKSKGAKSLKLTTDNLFRRRAEFEREIKRIEYEIEKLKKEAKEIIERRDLVAKEQAAAKDKFDVLLQNKNFELLEWDAAIKELEFLKSNFKTPEGAIAADEQLKKVLSMKFVQEVIVNNLKDYQFKKSKLGKIRARVREADLKEIKLSKPDGKDTKKETNFKINWVKFYKEYHANFNELIIQFIENGRKNCNPKLTLQEWGDAMCGAALTLHLICADDPAAATRGEQIAKDVAKNFPSYVKMLRMMFPNVTFEDALEE